GTWVSESEAQEARLLETDLRPRGARLGARAIVVLPTNACGICESAGALRYLADSSAGQCGPCVHGLGAIAASFERLAGAKGRDERQQLSRWIAQVRGRGACRHPDGTRAFAASALKVFAREADPHLHGACPGKPSVLPVVTARGSRCASTRSPARATASVPSSCRSGSSSTSGASRSSTLNRSAARRPAMLRVRSRRAQRWRCCSRTLKHRVELLVSERFSAGSCVRVEPLDVVLGRPLFRVLGAAGQAQLERAITEGYAYDPRALGLVSRRRCEPGGPGAGRVEERCGVVVRILDHCSSFRSKCSDRRGGSANRHREQRGSRHP